MEVQACPELSRREREHQHPIFKCKLGFLFKFLCLFLFETALYDIMKPFLILQLRPIDLASDNEFDAFLHYGDIAEHQVHRIRMDKRGIPDINIEDYSGIIIGGGPSNVSDTEKEKHDYQKRFETDLFKLLEEVFKRDVPVLGNCYGIGAIAKFMGGEVSKEKYSEGIGAVEIELNEMVRLMFY